MKIEVSVHWSGGRVERHSFDPDDTALMQICISRFVDIPAFKGEMHICNIEVRPIK